MATTTVIMQTEDTSGKENQQTVTYINPDASNSTLFSFTKKFNAFSTDKLKDVYRVDKESIKNATA